MPQIDPRGPRFAAAVTSVVLAAVLLSPAPLAIALIALQTALFAVGAGLGVQHTPYAWVFRKLVRPRLGPPSELEDAAPPRFAQAVGLVFATVALVGFLAGATTVGARRHRVCAGGRPAQRRARPVPRLRDVPPVPPVVGEVAQRPSRNTGTELNPATKEREPT